MLKGREMECGVEGEVFLIKSRSSVKLIGALMLPGCNPDNIAEAHETQSHTHTHTVSPSLQSPNWSFLCQSSPDFESWALGAS